MFVHSLSNYAIVFLYSFRGIKIKFLFFLKKRDLFSVSEYSMHRRGNQITLEVVVGHYVVAGN